MLAVPLTEPLKLSFSIPAEYLDIDISLLTMFVSKGDNRQRSIVKLTNILRRNGLHTIRDMVNTDARRIRLMKYMGDKSFSLLLELLHMISEKKKEVVIGRF